IIDSTYSYSLVPSPVTTLPAPIPGVVTTTVVAVPYRYLYTPKARVTVVPGGTGKPISFEYSGLLQLVGTGKHGVYVAGYEYSLVNTQQTVSPRKLLVLNAGPGGN